MRIAVAGNPNAGKTTLFNALTGARAHVGNYAGVTVESREADVTAIAPDADGQRAQIVDLPGCYSLTARSPEEEVAHAALMGQLPGGAPQAIICVVDATQLPRGLYLALQLLEHRLPVVLALSMVDLAAARGRMPNVAALAARLGVVVVPVHAQARRGLAELYAAARAAAAASLPPGPPPTCAALDPADAERVRALQAALPLGAGSPGHALWLLTTDLERLALRLPEAVFQAADAAQRAAGDLAALRRRVIEARYAAVDRVLADTAAGGDAAAAGDHGDAAMGGAGGDADTATGSAGRRADAALAGAGRRADAALPGTGRREDAALAGAGRHADAALPGAGRRADAGAAPGDQAAGGHGTHLDDDGDRVTAALDRVLLHPVGGGLVFALAMFLLFQAVFAGAEPLLAATEAACGWLAQAAGHLLPAGNLRSLVVYGLVGGIATVAAFVPQIALLFGGIALLEQSGYMARAAFLVDRLMRRAGLHGHAFIPLMSSFACAVPGVMATRTIASRHDRLVTIMVAPLMSCSARLPVYTLVIAALFSGMAPLGGVISVGGLLMAAMYGLGFVAALITAWLLKRTALRAPLPPLLLELPSYRMPRLRALGQEMAARSMDFVREAGPVIVALSMLLWGLLSFPNTELPPERATTVAAAAARSGADPSAALARENRAWRLEHSFAGQLGHAIEPAIRPLGFDWRIGIGLIASFAAREVLVSTLSQVYAIDAGPDDGGRSLRAALRADVAAPGGHARLTPLSGLSLMVFFVLALQCLSTVAVVRRETGGWRWPLAQLAYMNALAYVCSLAVYQGGVALGLGL